MIVTIGDIVTPLVNGIEFKIGDLFEVIRVDIVEKNNSGVKVRHVNGKIMKSTWFMHDDMFQLVMTPSQIAEAESFPSTSELEDFIFGK